MIFGEGTLDVAFLEQDIGCLTHIFSNFERHLGIVNVAILVIRPVFIGITAFTHGCWLGVQGRVVRLELSTVDNHYRALRYVTGGGLAVFNFPHDRFPFNYLAEDDMTAIKVRCRNRCDEL